MIFDSNFFISCGYVNHNRDLTALLAQLPRRQAFGLLDNSVILKHMWWQL